MSKPQVIVVGGSLGGVTTALSLLQAGCDVTVLERASKIVPTTGQGLGLDSITGDIIAGFGLGDKYKEESLPEKPFAVNQWVSQRRVKELFTSLRAEGDNSRRYTHWGKVHSMLAGALPEGVMKMEHSVKSFEPINNGKGVKLTVTVGRGESATTEFFEADMVVGADGINSTLRSIVAPQDQKRYAGYVIWRGTFSPADRPEAAASLRQFLPLLDDAIYLQLAKDTKGLGTHVTVTSVPGEKPGDEKRIMWELYTQAPEPKLTGDSVSIMDPDKESDFSLADMLAECDIWSPQLAAILKATEKPFITVVYERDPLVQWVYGRVVLLGEAAHPCTPHIGRSTNMSFADADALGKAVAASSGDLEAAALAFQTERLSKANQEVLFSRVIGRYRQSMLLPEGVKDWGSASREAVSIFDETQLRRFDWKTFLESGKVVLEGPKISSRQGPLKSATGRPRRKMQVIISGGSVGGVSAALGLVKAGCDVIILERASGMPQPTTGAGLGLSTSTRDCLQAWGIGGVLEILSDYKPYECQQFIMPDRTPKNIWTGERFLNRFYWHWADLHALIHDGLPSETVRYRRTVSDFEEFDDEDGVHRIRVTAQVPGPDGTTVPEVYEADLLVAADGGNSIIRAKLNPQDSRRYTGYVTWRGVMTDEEQPDLMERLRQAYPIMKDGVVFDLASSSTGSRMHTVLYSIPGNRINWQVFEDLPDPKLPGYSVTIYPPPEMLQNFLNKEKLWTPVFAELLKKTKDPFINVLYDRDPLSKWTYGRVVLVGEAAHCTTPHIGRSTNMSIEDSYTLGKLMADHAWNVESAIAEYEDQRLYNCYQEVLFSRNIGQLRQGQYLPGGNDYWATADEAACSVFDPSKLREFDWQAYLEGLKNKPFAPMSGP